MYVKDVCVCVCVSMHLYQYSAHLPQHAPEVRGQPQVLVLTSTCLRQGFCVAPCV